MNFFISVARGACESESLRIPNANSYDVMRRGGGREAQNERRATGSRQDLAMAMSWPSVADVFDVKERDFHFDWKCGI